MSERASDPASIQAMFSRIVRRYDLLNDLMTGRRHRHWKRLAVGFAQPKDAEALDLGTGTGDIALELVRQGARLVTAGDVVPAMLQAAEVRAKRAGVSTIRFTEADALDLPFGDETFDCVTSGFMIRNVSNAELAFAEMHRVLRPGGRVVCLEASRRTDLLGRVLHPLFGVVAGVLGRVIAGDKSAYSYLSRSVAGFETPQALAATMQRAGFKDVRVKRLGSGLIAIHHAIKARDWNSSVVGGSTHQ